MFAHWRPAEDFARGALTFRDAEGHEVMVEATNSWAYVGAGLRILIELLGPEYSMEFSSLNTGLKVFLSREVTGEQGEDLVEKQNAEQGLMPAVENEPDIYGYIGEDRHMVEAFRHRRQPMETFHDGIAVAEIAAEAHLLPVIATRMAKSVASMEIRSSVPAQDLGPQLWARLRR
jgi:predicted dehydrogenase